MSDLSLQELHKVTIIAERVLEDRLIDELKAAGAKGWTAVEVSGEGSRGVRASEFEGRNLKLEAIVSEEVARRLLSRLTQDYFEHYAVVAYVEHVRVVRGDKYV